jgi:hypothetical protein
MIRPLHPRSLSSSASTKELVVKRRTYIIIAFLLLLVALCGWAVEGARWAMTGTRSRRPRLAPAA